MPRGHELRHRDRDIGSVKTGCGASCSLRFYQEQPHQAWNQFRPLRGVFAASLRGLFIVPLGAAALAARGLVLFFRPPSRETAGLAERAWAGAS